MAFFNDDVTGFILSIQDICKKFLGFIIISNFIIIFALQLQIRIKAKIKAMFDIKELNENSINSTKTVLIITAHPDDEIMFLSPTLKQLSTLNIKKKILCMSTGNYDGIGHIRKQEFNDVSKALHMEDNKIIDHPDLQDNLKKRWNEKIVAEQIKNYINENKDIGTIITFDEKGVTKHPNHMSVYAGLEEYIKSNRKEIKDKNINIYLLDSFSPIKQYTNIIPFLSMFFKEFGYFDWNCLYSWKHMKIYKSQFNFPRRMHVIFSGYSYSNSFTKVEVN